METPQQLICMGCKKSFPSMDSFTKNQWKKFGRLICKDCSAVRQELLQLRQREGLPKYVRTMGSNSKTSLFFCTESK
jgi:hypothetical protein